MDIHGACLVLGLGKLLFARNLALTLAGGRRREKLTNQEGGGDKAPSGAPEDITAAAGFTDCRARELSEVLHFGALSRALDAQPANHEYTSYADGPISPSHSMHSLDGPVKRSAKSDVVGPLCW